jgi:hypothetical protein
MLGVRPQMTTLKEIRNAGNVNKWRHQVKGEMGGRGGEMGLSR